MVRSSTKPSSITCANFSVVPGKSIIAAGPTSVPLTVCSNPAR
jgi:hypothetical protein